MRRSLADAVRFLHGGAAVVDDLGGQPWGTRASRCRFERGSRWTLHHLPVLAEALGGPGWGRQTGRVTRMTLRSHRSCT